MDIRTQLIKLYTAQAWKQLSYTDLDTGFQQLSDAEKTVIIESLKNDDENARILIKQKLLAGIDAYAQTQADAVIASGLVPISLITEIL